MRHAAGRLLAVGFLVLSGAAWCEAASGNADGTYTVTVTQIEMSSDGGSTYTTVFSGSQAINIASVSAGATAAGLVKAADLATGTYTRLRVTIGANLLLKGYVNNGSQTIFTNGGTGSDGFSTNTNAADTPGGTYATSTFTVPADNRINTMTVSIPVSRDVSATAVVKFDVSGVITQAGGIPSVGAPVVTVTVS